MDHQQNRSVKFGVEPVNTCAGPALWVNIELMKEAITPQDFVDAVKSLTLHQDVPGLGVILNGRAPIWGYAMLCHLAHPFAWVATFDPRLGGGVVVQSHWPGVETGSLVRRLEEGD